MTSEQPRKPTPTDVAATTPVGVELLGTLKPLEAIQPLRIEAGSGSSSSKEETSGTTEDNNNSNNNKNKDNEDDEEAEDVEAESSKEDELPSYLLRLVTRLDNIDLHDVNEEAVEGGDGEDSDVGADDCLDHDEAMVSAQAEQLEDDDLGVEDNDRASVVLSHG